MMSSTTVSGENDTSVRLGAVEEGSSSWSTSKNKKEGNSITPMALPSDMNDSDSSSITNTGLSSMKGLIELLRTENATLLQEQMKTFQMNIIGIHET